MRSPQQKKHDCVTDEISIQPVRDSFHSALVDRQGLVTKAKGLAPQLIGGERV